MTLLRFALRITFVLKAERIYVKTGESDSLSQFAVDLNLATGVSLDSAYITPWNYEPWPPPDVAPDTIVPDQEGSPATQGTQA